jgi:uncharacterized protein YjbI with pentapeptide repeats
MEHEPMKFLVLSVFALALAAAVPAQAGTADGSASVKVGPQGCPNCALAGTDLSNQCLQNSDFSGADLDDAKLVLTCLSHANLRDTKLRRADLSGANLFDAKLDGADFSGALLSSTSLKSADLRRSKGLTQAQLASACGDAGTRLPAGLSVKACQ